MTAEKSFVPALPPFFFTATVRASVVETQSNRTMPRSRKLISLLKSRLAQAGSSHPVHSIRQFEQINPLAARVFSPAQSESWIQADSRHSIGTIWAEMVVSPYRHRLETIAGEPQENVTLKDSKAFPGTWRWSRASPHTVR